MCGRLRRSRRTTAAASERVASRAKEFYVTAKRWSLCLLAVSRGVDWTCCGAAGVVRTRLTGATKVKGDDIAIGSAMARGYSRVGRRWGGF